LIVEFRGTPTPYIFKVLGPGTALEHVRVGRIPGVYISGAPHQVLFMDRTGRVEIDRVRLAGNVLLWPDGPVLVRIEGARTLDQALGIARSLR
jgi:hypothetical protein